MPRFTDQSEIATALKGLGIADTIAEALAAEQVNDGSPHVETTSFLRIVNSFVCKLDAPESLDYVHSLSAEELETNLFAKSVRRMLDSGVSPLDIKTVIRETQCDLLENVFSLLDNVSDYDGLHENINAMKKW
ncbi:hypothetical protein [Aporhodopirellula aestuarii]|uniref:Uncharacterized protein n=1 Tax=Aporhodopirellula aestuarii TaxID=2950107 RepID=A0ABT0U163_9BACT|nr:hypothetical protein [Aporhodopirellula aestuarii]MCM2370608.1 hypothetical protein [Aporhodopirellula aestuarii]